MLGPSMYLGGLISEKYGPKRCMMLGGVVIVSGTLLASTATSLFGLILTHGVPFGVGMGITYAAPIAEAIKWVPAKKGLFTGIVVAGLGAGAFVFGTIAIAVVNPDDQNVNPKTKYFDQSSGIPERVPTMYLVLGCCYAIFYSIGIVLLSEKPPDMQLQEPLGDGAEVELLVELGKRNTDERETDHAVTKRSYAPGELLYMPIMWHVASCLVLTSAGGMYLAGTFKMYGEAYIDDESFLTLVAETAAVFNAGGRIFWGFLADRYTTVDTLMVLTVVFATVIITFSNLGMWLGELGFAIWSYALFFCQGGYFALYMPLAVQIFGVDYSSSNYGMIFSVYTCFVVLNIVLLTQSIDFKFSTVTLIIGSLTYVGLANLYFLKRHMVYFKKAAL